MKNIISFFANRHLVTNFLAIGVLFSGILVWFIMNKEEMPDMTFDTVRISTSYPGASPEDVEYFVTRPIEEALQGLDGIDEITSTSSQGSSSITVELEKNFVDRDTIVSDIKSYVSDVSLPEDIDDDPEVREFKTSRKAIIDVALYYKDKYLLETQDRLKLQSYADNLENKLLSLPSVSDVSFSGYQSKELQVELNLDKLKKYDIAVVDVYNALRKNNIRIPIGTLETDVNIKLSLQNELDTVEKIGNIIVQGSFEEKNVKIKEIANVKVGFEDTTAIIKVNGKEAVICNVTKNSSVGILDAVKAVKKNVDMFFPSFKQSDPDLNIIFMDDESRSIKDRISLITVNGLIGFSLILVLLFIFLNTRSALWVAAGIPFSFCFTLSIAYLLGYSINNITLSAIVIVMGMIVDDAIVVSEHISRLEDSGVPRAKAVVEGTGYVFLPVLASVLTTCVAFVPLFFFGGRMGLMIKFIPVIIFLMLGGSLIESLFILPAHLNLHYPDWLKKIFHIKKLSIREKLFKSKSEDHTHWFNRVEDFYGKILEKILKYKYILFAVFIILFVLSGWIFMKKMKFTMFPNEETDNIRIVANALPGTKKYQTENMLRPIEDFIAEYEGTDVDSFRSSIARNRRGSAARENEAMIRVELIKKEERKRSVRELTEEWTKKFSSMKNFAKLMVSKDRFGQSSGSTIEILIQDNNEKSRDGASKYLLSIMQNDASLINVDEEQVLKDPEYKISLKEDLVSKLNVDPSDISTTFKAAIEGLKVYDFREEDNEVDVKIFMDKTIAKDVNKIMQIPVKNNNDYLIPMRNIIDYRIENTPNEIKRDNLKRVTTLYSDISSKSKMSPLDVAKYYEENVFPKILEKYPSVVISFGGEIEDSREAGKNFLFASILAVLLIYFILAVLFDSLFKPFIIMLAIPFGIIGVVLAFYLHGHLLYGFFSVIGILGLSGVVINDSIVMLTKLEDDFEKNAFGRHPIRKIANISKTRLRAVFLTTVTTVAGLMPSAYGIGGYDSMLAEMMLAMSWGLLFGTFITLFLVPSIYSLMIDIRSIFRKWGLI